MQCTLDIAAALEQFFGFPSAQVLSQAFAVGMTPMLTLYLVGYCVGKLVSMFDDQ